MRLLQAFALFFLLPALAGAQTPAPAPPRGTHFVYLIRHGIYDRDDSVDDATGNGLNALGREQARLLGERLKALPIQVNSLVASNYTRAKDTAAEIAAILEVPVLEDTLIHECSARADRPDYMKDKSPGEIADCESNLEAAWKKYMIASPEADRYDLLVCHGNVIRWFVARAAGARTENWLTMDIGNASLTIIAVRPDGTPRLVMFSDVGHLPPDKQTWSGRGGGWIKR